MTRPARAGPVPAPRPWVPATLAGVAAFVFVALAALALGVVDGSRPDVRSVPAPLEAGRALRGTFHGAGVEVRAGLPSSGADVGLVNLSGLSTVHITFLTGTILAGAVLWRAGRHVGRLAGDERRRRIAGAAIAPAYGLLVLAAALLVHLSFPASGFTDVRVVAWQAFVGATMLAAVAGGVGGRGPRSPPCRGARPASAAGGG